MAYKSKGINMKESSMSIFIKDQLKDFLSSTPLGVLAYRTVHPFKNDVDAASMHMRISDTGGIYATVIFKKPNWGIMVIREKFGRKPGFGSQSLINLSVEIHNYLTEKKLILFHTELLHEHIESLPEEYVEHIEDLAYAKGYQTCYQDMTIEDVEKVIHLMKENPQKTTEKEV